MHREAEKRMGERQTKRETETERTAHRDRERGRGIYQNRNKECSCLLAQSTKARSGP